LVERFDFVFFAFDRFALVDLRATAFRFAFTFDFDFDFDFIDHFEGAASADDAGSEVAANATATTSSSVRNMGPWYRTPPAMATTIPGIALVRA